MISTDAFRLAPSAEVADRLVDFPASGSVTITGATLIDGLGNEPLRGVSIVVRDGVIAEIRHGELTGPRDPGHAMLDWTGLFVTPGLIDCHIHLNGLLDDRSIERYPLTRVLRAAASVAK